MDYYNIDRDGMRSVWEVAQDGKADQLRGRKATLVTSGLAGGDKAYDVQIRSFRSEGWRIQLMFNALDRDGEQVIDEDGYKVWGQRTWYDFDKDSGLDSLLIKVESE